MRYGRKMATQQISALSRHEKSHTLYAYGVTPSAMYDDNLDISYLDPMSDLPVTQQLYTARGSQSLLLYEDIKELGVDPANIHD